MTAALLQIVPLMCFVAFFVVAVTIYDARRATDNAMAVPSLGGWILLSLGGGVFWAFAVLITSIGHNSPNPAAGLGLILLLGGPPLYLYSAYRWYRSAERAKQAGKASAAE